MFTGTWNRIPFPILIFLKTYSIMYYIYKKWFVIDHFLLYAMQHNKEQTSNQCAHLLNSWYNIIFHMTYSFHGSKKCYIKSLLFSDIDFQIVITINKSIFSDVLWLSFWYTFHAIFILMERSCLCYGNIWFSYCQKLFRD